MQTSDTTGPDKIRKAVVRFDSLDEIREIATTKHRNHPCTSGMDYNSEWFGGVRDWAQLDHLVQYGWEEHTEDTMNVATETLAAVEREFEIEAFRSRYDVAGADVDVARYLSGEPENMITFDLVNTPAMGRVVPIVANIAVSAIVDTDLIIQRGKMLAALIFAIESTGLRTEVWADAQIKGWGEGTKGRVLVKVKDAADTLDPASVLMALAHPAFFRAMMLSVMHEFPEDVQSALGVGSGGYGCPENNLVTDLAPEDAITVQTGLRSDTEWPTDPKEFVTSKLRELGLIHD